MPTIYVPECRSWLDLNPGSKDLEAYNIERVRSYIENNPQSPRKNIVDDLCLSRHTVDKAVSIIRKQQGLR